MRVAVVGLYSIKNVGDNVLCSSTIWMLKQIDPDVEIVKVDVNPPIKTIKKHGRIRYILARIMLFIQKYLFNTDDNSTFRYKYEYLMWYLKANRHFRNKLEGCDAVVFGGGGFLKFRTQGLNYYVEQIIKIAKEKNILIMMNGVGVEGYDENDIRCQSLKKAINDDLVKVITTRDDYDILKNDYIYNPNTITAKVGDPALWVPQVYDAARSEEISDVVAVNLIRGKVYQDYGNAMSPEMLKNFYRQLIVELNKREINWVMFSNGMKADNKFGVEVLKSLGYKKIKKKIRKFKNAKAYINFVSKVACTFGARLHACIISYSIDVPVVGLIWNDKTEFFSEAIGKREYYFNENELDPVKVVDAIEKAKNDTYDTAIREELKKSTFDKLNEFYRILRSEKGTE